MCMQRWNLCRELLIKVSRDKNRGYGFGIPRGSKSKIVSSKLWVCDDDERKLRFTCFLVLMSSSGNTQARQNNGCQWCSTRWLDQWATQVVSYTCVARALPLLVWKNKFNVSHHFIFISYLNLVKLEKYLTYSRLKQLVISKERKGTYSKHMTSWLRFELQYHKF